METPYKQSGSGIIAGCTQEILDSASNASSKGMAQWNTPREFGELVAIPLPDLRRTIVDLNAGSGQLLFAAKNGTTRHLLGSDIDPRRASGGTAVPAVSRLGDRASRPQSSTEEVSPGTGETTRETRVLPITRLTGDVTKLFPLFNEVSWQADLFVLNPPFSLHWHRNRLQELAESPLYTVQSAFLGHDPLCGRDAIDSTAATLMMALHLMSARGEGVMIANQATLERLIFNADAPHRQLRSHIWANVILKGNPMTKDKGDSWTEEFRTGVIYFAKAHSSGCRVTEEVPDLATFKLTVENLKRDRRSLRMGYDINIVSHCNDDTVRLWTAVRDEWAIRNGKKDHGGYNIFLRPDGTIGTYLSLFERTSFKVNKAEVEKLNELNGHRPMALVVQREQRNALLRAVSGGIWRVEPSLPEKVQEALRQYDGARAPLQKLSPIQSLGHIDDCDEIECIRTVHENESRIKSNSRKMLFVAGQKFKLTTKTVKVQRKRYKPGLGFEDNEYLLDGRELLITVIAADGSERSFMDARHCAPGVTIDADLKVDFYLDDMVKFFRIPCPADVAECNPEGFQANVNAINRLEEMMNEVTTL